MDKLTILADAAKYDAACTSSGLDRNARSGRLGSTMTAGCCHSFSADGRCITLLKVLLTNRCCYDCQYCVNRRSNDVPRAAFEPRELAELTIGFYRRNYIEGLFLSSAVWGSPDRTTERMIEALRILRQEYGFWGYVHAKAIPGADPLLTRRLGQLADRMSVNIELPSEASLNLLAPDKGKQAILKPMAQIRDGIVQSKAELAVYRHAPRFAPAGQSTQMIVGATPESDRHILTLSQALYDKYKLKRVFYSAYMPVSDSKLLPAKADFKPPLLREHRQAVRGGLAAAVLPLSGGGAAGREFAGLRPAGGSQVLLGAKAHGFLPRGGEHSGLRSAAAGAGGRRAQRPAHPYRPALWAAGLPGPEKAGSRSEAGAVFPHLLGQNTGGPAGEPGWGAAPSGGPGKARPGGDRGGAAVPI